MALMNFFAQLLYQRTINLLASSYVLPDTPSCIGVADTFRFQPIQLSEVLSALKGLDTRKSAGSNGIPVFFNTR